VVAWRVVDTAKAVFDVDDFGTSSRSGETAVAHLASLPYGSYEDGQVVVERVDESRTGTSSGSAWRTRASGRRARLSHLSYAPEIAG
jgi:hypothetical protein